jgi:hypothetical protein
LKALGYPCIYPNEIMSYQCKQCCPNSQGQGRGIASISSFIKATKAVRCFFVFSDHPSFPFFYRLQLKIRNLIFNYIEKHIPMRFLFLNFTRSNFLDRSTPYLSVSFILLHRVNTKFNYHVAILLQQHKI